MFWRGSRLAEEMGSREGTEVARDWARRADEMMGEKCTSFDDLLSKRLSSVVVFGFSVRGEKFSLFASSAGVGSKAMEGDFGAISCDVLTSRIRGTWSIDAVMPVVDKNNR